VYLPRNLPEESGDMIPDLALLIGAYCVARLMNTSLFDGDPDDTNRRALRIVVSLIAIAVIVWMVVDIFSIANDTSNDLGPDLGL
jgi:hypothetical protein